MANELQTTYTTAKTLYAVILNASGQAWNTATPAFENIAAANWANYAVSLTLQSTTQFYVGSFPAGITTPGRYGVNVFAQVGVSPATTDTYVGGQILDWTGAAEQTFIEMMGLLGLYSGLRNPTYTSGNLTSYDLCLYDTAAHATTNDGATGLLHKYTVSNSYDGSNNLLTSVRRRVS